MSNSRQLCPVCLRTVQPTMNHNIAGHMDKNHTPCPGSFINYTLTLQDGRPCASSNANAAAAGGPPTPEPPTASPDVSVPLASPTSPTSSVSTHPADH